MFKPVKFLSCLLGTVVFCAFMALSCGTAEASRIYIVDIGKVYAESEAAKAADKHVEKVRKVLQKGLDDLKARLDKNKDLTQKERDHDLVNGHRVLERQMQIEIQAARNAVHEVMMDCIKTWRKKNGGTVMARGQVLDYYHKRDITDTVITEMNKKEPKFADMPVVKFNEAKKGKE